MPADEVLELLGSIRAIRRFTDDPVPVELVEQLVWAATRAPSPGNSQGWDFVAVDDREVLGRIGAAVDAGMSGAIAALPRTDPSTARTLEGAAHLARTLGSAPLVLFVGGRPVYPPDRPSRAMVWSAVYPATQNLLVAARALGLGAAMTTLHMAAEPTIRAELHLPDDLVLAATIPLGWPAQPFGPVRRKPVREVLHFGRWSPRHP